MYKALLIGINYVGTESELHGCINDVDDMEYFIKARFNAQVTKITDEKCTKANILDAIKHFISSSRAGDKLLFHYSGHGSQVKDLNGDEMDHLDEVIVPVDYLTNGFICDDELFKLFHVLNKDVHLTCVFDCCFSGSIMDLKYEYDFGENIYTVMVHKQYPSTLANVVCISGCLDTQTSADAVEQNPFTKKVIPQGALTYCLLTTLQNQPNLTYRKFMLSILEKLKGKYTQIAHMTSGRHVDVESEFTLM